MLFPEPTGYSLLGYWQRRTRQRQTVMNADGVRSHHKPKVFCVGMYKTGTTSISAALSELGFKEFQFRSPFEPGKDLSTTSFALVPGLDQFKYDSIQPLVLDSPSWGVLKEAADKGTSFAEGPWLFLFQEWDRLYPNSKFILSLRKGPTELDAATSAANSDLAMWKRLGLYHEIRQHLSDEDILQNMIRRYIQHVKAVRQHFAGREKSLMEICLAENTDEENWSKLTQFLGVDTPKTCAFPKLNAAP